jgi:hypothetical protein
MDRDIARRAGTRRSHAEALSDLRLTIPGSFLLRADEVIE